MNVRDKNDCVFCELDAAGSEPVAANAQTDGFVNPADIFGEVRIMRNYIERSMSYKDYLALIDCLLAEGKTTGAKQSDKMYGYGKLNRQRMSRLEKTVSLSETVRSRISELDVDWVWLILTEGWCGDAAQNIPVIEKVASANAGIETRYLLRDENPGLMDEYLTDGARSIPKLIAIDRRTNKVLGTWGSRPEAGRRYFRALKSQGVVKPELDEYMQRWYNADLGVSLQKELAALALQWADTANDRKSLPVAA